MSETAPLDVQQLLEAMVGLNASDLHLTVGSPPMYRINGDLRPVDCPALKPAQTEEAVRSLAPANKRAIFDEVGTADFSFAIPGQARFRVNIFHQRGSAALAVRQVNQHIPSIEELKLPKAVKDISQNIRGLVLVTGVTGSGKSTTLASMIDYINSKRRSHIITIEDPVEFLHTHKKSIVNQIELGVDTQSFKTALKHVLRQDPDVILFGELRDRISLETALTATETGHLVFGTLHTSNARQTVHRILNLFDSADKTLILDELAHHLQAVISQRLVRSADRKSRLPAVEILVNIPIVAKLIAEDRIEDLEQAMKNGEEGMQTFNMSLCKMVQKEKITLEEGLKYCEDSAAFRRMVQGRFSEGDNRAIVG